MPGPRAAVTPQLESDAGAGDETENLEQARLDDAECVLSSRIEECRHGDEGDDNQPAGEGIEGEAGRGGASLT